MIESLPNEMWKTISEFPNYQISNYGRVKSLNYRHTNKERILKPFKSNSGYFLIDFGKRNRKLIHRLVAEAFLPNDDLFKTQVNHIDENKENNNVNNLEWVSPKENINYGSRNEKASKKLKNHPQKSKQINQYDLDGNYIKNYPSAKEIQRQLGFNNSHIVECCKDKLKTSHGFIWRFA